ncbi:transglycosylase domain-containing protein, partial [Mycolicibacterium hippocampi]|uniref:transglycosylase domain-containing protein n=1 Tax=Mycolicibacterium hippocampi TaxID=659824 RepID=UPI0035118D7D
MGAQGRATWGAVARLAGSCLLAGLLAAALMFPFVGGAGSVILRVSDSATEESTKLLEGEVPIVSTMVDAAGNPIAWLYEQRRWVVPSNRIANTMKLAMISIEDKRFTEHNGVDWQGTLTGLAGYLQGATSTRGGSTI